MGFNRCPLTLESASLWLPDRRGSRSWSFTVQSGGQRLKGLTPQALRRGRFALAARSASQRTLPGNEPRAAAAAGGRAATGSARGPEGSRFPVLIGRAGQLALYGPRAKTGPTCREGEATPRAGPQARRPVSRRFWKREPRVTPDWLECPPGAGRGDHKRTGRAAPRALAPRELAPSADGRTDRLTD